MRAERRARLVLVRRRAAEGRKRVGRQRGETFERNAPRHVLDVRVEAAVLVDDDDAGRFAAPAFGVAT
jgi:hypothetical protein